MGKIEAFLGGEIYAYIFSPKAQYLRYMFLGRAIVFTTIELLTPARRMTYWKVLFPDLAAWAAVAYLIAPIAYAFNALFFGNLMAPPAKIMALHWALRIAIAIVLADFGRYWVHRLMHTRYLWVVHKWHHSPTYMYWLAGARATVTDIFLSSIPYLLVGALYEGAPRWALVAYGLWSSIQNDWMHLNVSWRTRWMEWLIITPRSHHIHHSVNPKHFNMNMASVFSFWDRLFGTYVDPDTVEGDIQFGLGEEEHTLRMMIGV